MPNLVAKPSGDDAFAEMARAQREADGHLEPAHDSEGNVVLFAPECPVRQCSNNKDEMVANVFALFDSRGLGWLNKATAKEFGKPFLLALCEVLWEITDQWGLLAERSCKPAATLA